MPRLNSPKDLADTRLHIRQICREQHTVSPFIYVGMGTCGIAAGAGEVEQTIQKELSAHQIDAEVIPVGCAGMCAREPLVDIQLAGKPRITYANVKPSEIPEIITEHIINGNILTKKAYAQLPEHRHWLEKKSAAENLPSYHELPFYSKQIRIALKNCGMINPESIDDYISQDGYRALSKAVTGMSQEEIITEIKDSGLRGRGGAGFLTGVKWEFCYLAKGQPKFVICNADEGDPGAFMDRSVLEGDPHSLLEGMTIAGYAIGAQEGYIYCRAEYPLAIERLKKAISQAEQYGLLGSNILGTNFHFNLHIKEGAGAFVCGEETALMASIEGRRGEPRPRPPFPAVSGLWEKPSNVNNVKSYAMTPQIILNGSNWFKGMGTERSTGTAVFALTGNIKNTGLIEVPMGITLREIIYEIGGGIPKKKKFKAVQTGGPLGGCLPETALDTPVDFDSLTAAGATMGSGGMIVVDQDTCMVEFARYFLTFASAESCGKCVPCRLGGQRLLEILTRITQGGGTLDDLEEIQYISENMRAASLCALGQLTPGPVMASLRFFREEYEAHIVDKYCPAGVCKGLYSYEILEIQCRGCGLCIKSCPSGAITGSKKEPHVIDQRKCIQCGACYDVCNLEAITVIPKLETIEEIRTNN
ncbi:MAG: NADH-quinone oxidoreductase subunit NuoF [Anaerolineales bacterium]|nr:NADH-quinone oxidoreductase subunit NuoF [Anaerolineales bacterium]